MVQGRYQKIGMEERHLGGTMEIQRHMITLMKLTCTIENYRHWKYARCL